MRLRIISLACVIVLLFGLIPIDTLAAQTDCNTVCFDDGSYMEIGIEYVSTRATNTRVAYKYHRYYDSSDNLEWEAQLHCTFTYDGTTSSCTSASCTVTIYDSKWYEISNTTSRSGSTATTQLTMGRKLLGITVSKPQYTITLTCDKDGNLS